MEVAPRKKKKDVLKVVKGMNEEDLKKFMFPHDPVEPSFYELGLCMQLDAECKLDNPPPYVGDPFDPEQFHNYEIANKLLELIREECVRSKCHNIKPGDAIDLESLFFPCQGDYLIRRKGRGKIKAMNLKGKYIMVCCSYAPLVWGDALWLYIHACTDMYSKLEGNFEMVVVTKMRRRWTQPRAKEKDAFHQFFSAFPPPCLAVPIHARSRCQRIFSALGVGSVPEIFLVGPDGDVLLHRDVQYNKIDLVPINVIGYDTTPFPFISAPFVPESSWIVNSPSSLKRLLSPSSEFLFRKIMSTEEGGCSEPFVKEEVSLSDLSSKPVALYLYSTGEKLPLFRHVVEGCGQTNKDLEVVVVYLPIGRRSSSFPEMFSSVLAERGLSWWVAPLNFSASIVLEHMFEFQGDRVIIIGPNEQCFDVRGLQFMEIYGIYAYPFTFDSVVQTTVEELKQVTLDSFKKLLQIPECEEYPSTLKNALFYFDSPYDTCPSVYEQVCRFLSYKEVVDTHFISFAGNKDLLIHAENLKPEDCNLTDSSFKLWHIKGANKARDFFLRFFNHEFPTIVAFGEDGKICSVLAHKLPPSDGPELRGNLLEEVSSILEKYLTGYDDLEYANDDGGFVHGVEYMQELRQNLGLAGTKLRLW